MLLPCLRCTSTVESPASRSRSAAIVCSFANMDRVIVRSFLRPDSNLTWRRFRVAQRARAGVDSRDRETLVANSRPASANHEREPNATNEGTEILAEDVRHEPNAIS
jgi:hypothetical protein